MKIAHQLGCRTAYVGGEVSHKFRVVVYGEPGKTDTRDARPLLAAAGLAHLTTCLKTANSCLRDHAIEKIWEAAGQSVQLHDGGPGADYVAERLQRHYEHFERLDRERLVLRARLEAVYLKLREKDPRLPAEVDGVIKLYMLARIIAETGPLSDFRSIQQLYRFAGLNLCERKSGKYQGKTKISRKGRVALRRVLARAVLPLVRKGGLYGEWYHTPDGETKKGKGMSALMRKFLKMILGWYKSGREFDLKRVFTSAGDYAAKAA